MCNTMYVDVLPYPDETHSIAMMHWNALVRAFMEGDWWQLCIVVCQCALAVACCALVAFVAACVFEAVRALLREISQGIERCRRAWTPRHTLFGLYAIGTAIAGVAIWVHRARLATALWTVTSGTGTALVVIGNAASATATAALVETASAGDRFVATVVALAAAVVRGIVHYALTIACIMLAVVLYHRYEDRICGIALKVGIAAVLMATIAEAVMIQCPLWLLRSIHAWAEQSLERMTDWLKTRKDAREEAKEAAYAAAYAEKKQTETAMGS